MFMGTDPVQIPEGMILNARDHVPITIQDFGDGSPTPIARIERPDGSFNLNLGDIPPTGDPNPEIVTGTQSGGGSLVTLNVGPKPQSEVGEGGGGGGGGDRDGMAFPGTVISGSGNAYSVSILVSGVAETVDVTQMQIAVDEVIPSGTSCIVVKSGPIYYMVVPVWLS